MLHLLSLRINLNIIKPLSLRPIMIYYHIVASINNNKVIGIQNELMYTCKDDLSRFYQLTTQTYPEKGHNINKNILIMGYNTWESLPTNVKPLKKRLSIIVSKNHDIPDHPDTILVRSLQQAFTYCEQNLTGRVFVIGGASIFNMCWTHYPEFCQNLYLTHFYDTDTPFHTSYHYFPKGLLDNTTKHYSSPKQYSDCLITTSNSHRMASIHQHLIIHQPIKHINHGENQYLQLLQKILSTGSKTPSRNSLVYSLFGERMIFDLSQGFPLLTTKHMGYKTILRELLWFLRGSTSNKALQDKHVHIWDQNASKEFLSSRGLSYEEGDLGPVYGFQWRHSGATYQTCHTNYKDQGIDQIQYVIDLLKNDPHSRRIIVNSWNPSDLSKMALPPCHVMCQFFVNSDTKTLDCQLYQRSGDMFLGVPFNIASYAFLTHILAYLTDYKPGRLIHILGDAHIYDDHISQVHEQLKRVPIPFPSIEISGLGSDINFIEENHITIHNYQSYPKIPAPILA